MQTILVPSDFSKNAGTALRYGIRLSRLLKCRLAVFHCTHQTPYTVLAAANEEEMELMIRKDEEEKKKKLTKDVHTAYKYLGYDGIPSTTKVIVQFHPLFIEKTIDVAAQLKADLIVMGTHGASGISKVFFGSNTSVMISKSPVPVLAIPEKIKYRNIDTIVYSSDLENVEKELSRIIPFAKALQAAIEILHIDYGNDYGNKKTALAEDVISKCGYRKVRLIKQKASDKPLIKQIRQYLEKNTAQWLVMFTKERSFWNKILAGSKTTDLSMALILPLLSLKKK
jgi:nucleotide-binding universal stress UspA family protein